MKRKIFVLLVIGIFLFGLATYIGSTLSIQDETALYTLTSLPLDTSKQTFFQLDVMDTGFRLEADTDRTLLYYQEQLVGNLSVELSKISETGDYYYFLTYKPIVSLENPLVLRASIASREQEASYRYLHYPEHEQRVKEGSIDPLTPPDLQDGVLSDSLPLVHRKPLPNHSLYVDGLDFSLHLNRVNIYEPLGNGVRRAKDNLSPPFNYENMVLKEPKASQATIPEPSLSDQLKIHSFTISLPHLANHDIEQWGLIGQAGMFNWQDEEQRALYPIANLDRVRKWTHGGFQYITPTTYYPYDPNGFWLVPAQHVGNRLLLSGKDRFSTNMAILSLEAALATQQEEGMWLTQPRSEWLYGDYGIEAGFYDTRFSTDAGLFLIYGYRDFGDPRYLEGAINYANFLVKFAETHHFLTENGGYLVWDYRDGNWDGHTLKETHVSLNHLITEMNFLYELVKELREINPETMSSLEKAGQYLDGNIETQISTYLAIAEKMRLAVQDTRADWKKEENGDLWYAYMPDGSYGLLDYPLLTLKDLRYSQELIEELYGERDPAFQYLIEVKEAYLRSQGLPLYD